LNYAAFEEGLGSMERVKMIYEKILQIIPHSKFSFAKIWINYAHFLIRQEDLQATRKLLGRAIGIAPREKIFLAYVDLESQLS